MITPRRQHNQIPSRDLHPCPLVILPLPDIKVPRPSPDISNLVVVVNVLVPVHGDLVLVRGTHCCWRVGDFIAVGEGFGLGQVVQEGGGGRRGEVIVLDAEGGELGEGKGKSGVVGLAGVTLWR